jgi:hypothetical protein
MNRVINIRKERWMQYAGSLTLLLLFIIICSVMYLNGKGHQQAKYSSALIIPNAEYKIETYRSNLGNEDYINYSYHANGLLHIMFDRISFPYYLRIYDYAGHVKFESLYTFQKDIQVNYSINNNQAYIIEVVTADHTQFEYSILSQKES